LFQKQTREYEYFLFAILVIISMVKKESVSFIKNTILDLRFILLHLIWSAN